MKQCATCGAVYQGFPVVCPLDGGELKPILDSNHGRNIAGWQVKRSLFEGALANVYLVERKGVIGALKLYKSSYLLRRIERESHAQSLIRHPNIALLLDYGVTSKGEGFLVTEYIEGESLRQVTRRSSDGLPWTTAVEIAIQLADGLEAIHAQGIVHRDLKPENIRLIKSNGDGSLQVVLLDLGNAFLLDQTRLTESGLVWGSAPYMSPEQASSRTIDARSDLYALGVVLFEMLVGRRPFEAKAAVDVMQMHLTDVPPSPKNLCEIPSSLDELCLWLLAKQPELRPNSARVVGAALKGILNQKN